MMETAKLDKARLDKNEGKFGFESLSSEPELEENKQQEQQKKVKLSKREARKQFFKNFKTIEEKTNLLPRVDEPRVNEFDKAQID